MAAELGWPEGAASLPPPLAQKKQKIEQSVVSCLSSAGFSPIDLPTLEYVSPADAAESDDRCKFVAPDGRMLGLRYDHTTSLIRFVATHQNMPMPARLFYRGPVFRRRRRASGYAEVAQIGAEILGASGVEADIEIVRLLAKTLQTAGVPDFLIDIGTVEVFKGVMAGTKLDPTVLEDIRDAIHRKDATALKLALERSNLPAAKKSVLSALPAWFGRKDVLARALSAVDNDRSRAGLEQLGRVYDALAVPADRGGLGDRVTLDMGVVQSLDYYTGAVFEAYARRVGQPIASGGRYDKLADRYGKSIPATGFALNVGLMIDLVP